MKVPMISSIRSFSVLALLLTPCDAIAQQRTTAIYGDWTLSCAIASGSGAGKSCGLVQVQKINGQSAAVSQIGIGRAQSDPLKISIQITANAWMQSGVKLITNENALVITALFKWCTSTRCLADADLSDAHITTLRIQKDPGKIAYKTASQADVSIPVSFSGFSEAVDALQNQ
jgi:invasion protein IalB